MSYRNFTYEVVEQVARITINRPQAYNAVDLDSARELCDIVNRMADDQTVRANRLALLAGLAEAMNRVADISKLAA